MSRSWSSDRRSLGPRASLFLARLRCRRRGQGTTRLAGTTANRLADKSSRCSAGSSASAPSDTCRKPQLDMLSSANAGSDGSVSTVSTSVCTPDSCRSCGRNSRKGQRVK